jgi:hypothetical protein
MAREIDDTHDIAQLGARKAGDTPLGHTQPGMVQWREGLGFGSALRRALRLSARSGSVEAKEAGPCLPLTRGSPRIRAGLTRDRATRRLSQS